MAANKVNINPRYLTYKTDEIQALLDEVQNRSFFRDMTEEEYEALTAEEKANGDLYLLYEEED